MSRSLLSPIQAQKSNSRVLNFDSVVSPVRRFEPLTHALHEGTKVATGESVAAHVLDFTAYKPRLNRFESSELRRSQIRIQFLTPPFPHDCPRDLSLTMLKGIGELLEFCCAHSKLAATHAPI
jgi:hypothetical protein